MYIPLYVLAMLAILKGQIFKGVRIGAKDLSSKVSCSKSVIAKSAERASLNREVAFSQRGTLFRPLLLLHDRIFLALTRI
jgi:hypothetical protein